MKEQTKCYCGHTTTCDCGPEEPKQEIDMSKYIVGIDPYDKQETLEEAGERLYPNKESFLSRFQDIERKAFTEGVKWQQENSYSEEDMRDAYCNGALGLEYKKNFNESFNKWFEQFKKK